jgi:hypothetical protein
VSTEKALELEGSADSGPRSRVRAAFGLRHGARIYKLDRTPIVIGRSSKADIGLSSPLLSRRHASLSLSEHGFVIEDLGSRNGVLVNGERLERPRLLKPSDVISAGDETLVFVELDEPALRRHQTIATRVLESDRATKFPSFSDEDASVATRRADAFHLLGSVVDKALALGRGDEAEHLIGTHLVAALSDAKAGRGLSADVARTAASYALKLAVATSKPAWLDFPVRLYLALKQTMPLPIVDELYTLLRRVPGFDVRVLREYAADLRSRADRLPPTERFVLQRVDGLERLALLSAKAPL